MLYLVDTGVLLRAVDRRSPENPAILRSFRQLHARGDHLAISTQSVREFWNVSTRPATARGGYGRSVERTARWVGAFTRMMRVVAETAASFELWRQLVLQYQVVGAQVHDANILAVATVHSVDAIVTLNSRDFDRYKLIPAMTPQQLDAAVTPP